MRTTVPAGADFSAASSDRAYGEPIFPSAAGVWAVDSAGFLRRAGVRFTASFPLAASPADRGFGRPVVPLDRSCHISLSPSGSGGGASGVCGLGSTGRRDFIFLRIFRAFAAHMGLLDGHFGLFGTSAVPACSMVEKFLQKNCTLRKKALLFSAEMLYNKTKRMETFFTEGRRQTWQRKSGRQRKSAAWCAPAL